MSICNFAIMGTKYGFESGNENQTIKVSRRAVYYHFINKASWLKDDNEKYKITSQLVMAHRQVAG